MKNIFLAFFVAILWAYLASDHYLYENVQASFFGLNLYPLFAWAIGLFLSVYLFEKLFKRKNRFFKKFVYYFLFYSFCLIFLETVFYHFFGVVNLKALNYSGLPICDCLHAVWWMKISYFLIGPVYFLLFSVIKNFSIKKAPF